VNNLIEALKEANRVLEEVNKTIQDVNIELREALIDPETQKMIDHLNDIKNEDEMDDDSSDPTPPEPQQEPTAGLNNDA